MADENWQRKFEDPIPLPNGRKLLTLRDAADYIRPPKEGSRFTGLASRNRGAVGVAKWSDNAGADRGHAGAQPSRRAGVQSRTQRYPLRDAGLAALGLRSDREGRLS